MVPVVGKAHVPYRRGTDWIKAILSLADKLETESWGDNTHDGDGNKRETAAAFAKSVIPS